MHISLVAVLLFCVASALAFSPLAAPMQGLASTRLQGYVPDGMSKAEWEKIQKKEKATKGDLGKIGPTKFKSRSFAAWQADGGKHLFPVDPKTVKDKKDIPYMQRGGAWDDSDLGKGKAKAWTKKDVEAAEAAGKASSFFGFGGSVGAKKAAAKTPPAKGKGNKKQLESELAAEKKKKGWW